MSLTVTSRCSQNKVNRLLGDFIEDVREGKRESSLITDALHEASSATGKEKAWKNLQQELQGLGIDPSVSNQDRDFIISTLRKAVEEKGLLKSIKPKPTPSEINAPPTIIISSPTGPDERQATRENPPPLPPRPEDPGLSALFEKEVVITKGSPNPIPTSLQGASDTEKQVLPMDDFPIPVAMEAFSNAAGDSDKQALTRDDYPVPVAAEFSAVSNFNKQVVSRESISILTETESSSRDSSGGSSNSTPASLTRGKKPSIMHKMKYRLTNSKESFVSLIQMGKIYSVKMALDKGADVNTMNEHEQTALMVACSYGYEDIVKLLLGYGADTGKSSMKGETALGVAAGRGLESIVRVLLAHGATVKSKGRMKPGLSEAAASGYENIVRLLLDRGAEPDATVMGGSTALSEAARNGHVGVCRLLLDKGAMVDHSGFAFTGKTALWKAVHQGRTEVVRLLMGRGADPLRKDISGKTIVSLASTSAYDRTEILKIFRQYGYENTPFQYY